MSTNFLICKDKYNAISLPSWSIALTADNIRVEKVKAYCQSFSYIFSKVIICHQELEFYSFHQWKRNTLIKYEKIEINTL